MGISCENVEYENKYTGSWENRKQGVILSFLKWSSSIEKIVLYRKYVRYLCHANTIDFNVQYAQSSVPTAIYPGLVLYNR